MQGMNQNSLSRVVIHDSAELFSLLKLQSLQVLLNRTASVGKKFQYRHTLRQPRLSPNGSNKFVSNDFPLISFVVTTKNSPKIGDNIIFRSHLISYTVSETLSVSTTYSLLHVVPETVGQRFLQMYILQ